MFQITLKDKILNIIIIPNNARERVKLLYTNGINGTRVMSHLITATCSAPACPNGPPTGCVDCKYANHDFTLVTPLATN